MGQSIFVVECAPCHGVDAKGINYAGSNIKEYSNKPVATVLKNSKKTIIREIPHFDRKLSETQVKAITNYLRSMSEK